MKKSKLSLIALVLVLALLLSGCGKESAYKNAMTLYEEGQYLEAAAKFVELGDFEDSAEMVKKCRYEAAKALLDAGTYEEARALFEELGDYEDSAEYLTECDYNLACAMFDEGEYESAAAIFETMEDFRNSAELLEKARTEIMMDKYGAVLDALEGNSWYYNGGADTVLNRISFSGLTATISQVYFDGNGKHDNGSGECPFTVDDDCITVALNDGSELKIKYEARGGALTLGENEYFTIEEIEEGLQGYWNMRNSSVILGLKTVTDKNIYINNGKVVSERAALANGSTTGEYYYYGPYEGTYTLNFGGFDTDMKHGSEWFFNIIGGKVALLNYDHVCTPSDKLPGENGYKF